MKPPFVSILTVGGLAFLLGAPEASHGQQSDAPPTPPCHHKTGADDSHKNHDAMMHRGEKGMGFPQTTTTHHFLMKSDGGVIAVSANDPKDTATRDQIRMHLAHITEAFSKGDFDIPMFVHGEVPPGVPEMKKLAQEIRYRLKQTPAGGEVSISSPSPEAVEAIHEFLAYQIREHKTGDPVPPHGRR